MKLISRLFADVIINYKEGKATLKKGKILSRVTRDLAQYLKEQGVSEAEVHVGAGGTTKFYSIPKSLQQQVRNIINQDNF